MNKYVILTAPFTIVLIHKLLLHFGVKTICIWHVLTGHKCIGCGITSAMVQLIQGNFKLAYKTNSLIIIVAPILFYCWISFTKKNFSYEINKIYSVITKIKIF